MKSSGWSNKVATKQTSSIPLWLLAELTYACPLQCGYCSNPVDYPRYKKGELNTAEWVDVFTQGRALGALQLGLSGGEPLLRPDLEELIAEARRLGYYTNLITSTVGMDLQRVTRLREAGVDHIQVSFQGANAATNDYFAGTECFEHKVAMARAIKESGLPMVLNFVLHRGNIDQLPEMLLLADSLAADFVEIANCQYYGWAWQNRDALLPSRQQLQEAERLTAEFRQRLTRPMELFFVVPDYYNDTPKPCSNGWGTTFISVTPNGMVLPCHGAVVLPETEFPDVRQQSLADIWQRTELFNRFRGNQWMKQPCAGCEQKEEDFAGCRCQAYLLTGEAANTDPVCSKSPHRHLVDQQIERAAALIGRVDAPVIEKRNPQNSRGLASSVIVRSTEQ
ncbi:pyrroloquinoline quinone biosynthesis protein E [Sinobacterium caligoides]|uniref:PqqA peptide cyclase n=1 Tax=Sinobacterium caligoides TaxID=933926 RepID=A0A3N2DYU2_9GAMM|nr:pyrroloquinoline quinone biosynthesis protein PqqE [Sinobacterium caligoides]ROS05036.1 pyrroloquinoline quinone biosynthesis protein E [Sinobacterium caligoides]